jgi:hypothetical protein
MTLPRLTAIPRPHRDHRGAVRLVHALLPGTADGSFSIPFVFADCRQDGHWLRRARRSDPDLRRLLRRPRLRTDDSLLTRRRLRISEVLGQAQAALRPPPPATRARRTWPFPVACGQVQEVSHASDTRLGRCLFVRSVRFVKDSRCVEAPVRAPRLARVEVLEAPSSPQAPAPLTSNRRSTGRYAARSQFLLVCPCRSRG